MSSTINLIFFRTIDFNDTFLDAEHLLENFLGSEIKCEAAPEKQIKPFKIHFPGFYFQLVTHQCSNCNYVQKYFYSHGFNFFFRNLGILPQYKQLTTVPITYHILTNISTRRKRSRPGSDPVHPT